MTRERKDDKGRVLLTNESQIPNGSYTYRYVDENGKRRSITSWRLLPGDIGPGGDTESECLRDIEARLERSQIVHKRRIEKRPPCSFEEMWQKYLSMKVEVAENTLVSYIYLYNHHIRKALGRRPVTQIRYSDLKKFYISRIAAGLNISSIANLHNIISPVFALAIKEGYIETNPAEGLLQEFQRRKDWNVQHREALTETQQEKLVNFVAGSWEYRSFLPMLTLFLGTGMRIGELLGLTWEDVDFERNLISVNHTLNYDISLSGRCEYFITFPKTKNGARDIPMMKEVRETLEKMEQRREDFNADHQVVIDGFTHFVFRDLNGCVYNPKRINECLKRIVTEYNEKEAEAADRERRRPSFLPHITAHNLRHTFCTRLCENSVNIKTIQTVMGHAHAETTIRVYARATDGKNQEAFESLEGKFRIR